MRAAFLLAAGGEAKHFRRRDGTGAAEDLGRRRQVGVEVGEPRLVPAPGHDAEDLGSAMPGWALGQRSAASAGEAGIGLLAQAAEDVVREIAHRDVAAMDEQRRLRSAARCRLGHARPGLQLRRDVIRKTLQLADAALREVQVARMNPMIRGSRR